MNPSSRNPRSDAVVRYWIGVARWSLLILLAFELVIRSSVMRLPPFEYKPEWGLVPAANSSSVQGREGYGILHYLSDGEIRTPYQGGTSVVILGDSTVQAAQVNDEENFVSLTEQELRARGLNVDMRNLGGSERTIADHVFMAPAIREHFSPKVLIVQVSPASFSLSFYTPKENYFIKNADGSLELIHKDSSNDGLARRNILFSSGLISLLDFRWQVTSAEMAQQAARIRFGSAGEADPASRGNPQAGVGGSEEESRAQILLLVETLRKAYPDTEIVFLLIPYTPSIEPGLSRRISWVSGEDRQLAALLDTVEGVHLVYVQKVFEEYYRQYLVLPRGSFNSLFNFGHLNGHGHKAVAQTLTNALEQILK